MNAIAVPFTHLFLATFLAYGAPADVKEFSMEWKSYETKVTKDVTKDKIVVTFTVKDDVTSYEFKGTKVIVNAKIKIPGRTLDAKGEYDLKETFAVEKPEKWKGQEEIVLTNSDKKSVKMKVVTEKNKITIDEASGDYAAVLGTAEKKFPQATIKWKK